MPVEMVVDLDEFAACQEAELARFAARKRAENRKLVQELEKLAAVYRARIEANIDELARFQQALADWHRWRERETASRRS